MLHANTDYILTIQLHSPPKINRELRVCPLGKQHLSPPENIALRPQMLSLQCICALLMLTLLITAVLIHSLSIISKLQTYKIFGKLKEQLEPLNSGFKSGLQMVCIKIMLKFASNASS